MPKKARSRPTKKANPFVLWLESQVGKRHGVRYMDLAEEIGIKPASLTKRMRSGKFDYLEMTKLFKYLKATDEDIIRLMRQKGA